MSAHMAKMKKTYTGVSRGDLMRRGHPEEALATYLRGERYATWMECENAAECDKRARATGHRCQGGLCLDSEGSRVRNTRQHKIEALKKQLGRD